MRELGPLRRVSPATRACSCMVVLTFSVFSAAPERDRKRGGGPAVVQLHRRAGEPQLHGERLSEREDKERMRPAPVIEPQPRRHTTATAQEYRIGVDAALNLTSEGALSFERAICAYEWRFFCLFNSVVSIFIVVVEPGPSDGGSGGGRSGGPSAR